MITNTQKELLARCIERRLPFAVYQYPGESQATLLCDGSDEGSSIEFFAAGFAETMAHRRTLASPGPAPEPWSRSTTAEEHMERVGELTERLRKRGEAKTVLSTVHCMPCSPMQALEMACRLFERSKTEMCTFYSMPATGIWLGASPELLLECDPQGHFRTMALAATMPASETGWSQKNVSEHLIVADYIRRELETAGATFATGEMGEALYGSVKHLRTDFEGVLPSGMPAEKLIDALNPTPALCGYPLHAALDDIANLEQHPRLCYGGIVGTISPAGIKAYVNIRCAHIGSESMCIYAGGGIMPDSDPRSEWAEAQAKRASLLKMMLP